MHCSLCEMKQRTELKLKIEFQLTPDSNIEMIHIPLWLIVAGIAVLVLPVIYYIYDAYCKPQDVSQSE